MLNVEAVYFYIYAVVLVASALSVIFSPRMFLGVCAFFLTLLFSSLIYWLLSAEFIALFQFILCGLFLCIILMMILRKITILTLPLRVGSLAKIILTCIVLLIFGLISYFYMSVEFSGAINDIFGFINAKAADRFDFTNFTFPLHLVVIITGVMCVMLRNIYLTKNDGEN